MSDNKQSRDGRDSAKIDSNDASEVEYVHQQFPGLSHQQVLDAIEQEGPSREAVMKYLREKSGQAKR
ncbi:MAG: DUF3606 domain-containing protein [Sphingobacteriales bacterium]|nr:MAG: DUF3606 domain-containing protein [Sphingobacteriales bacterium]